MLFSFLMGSGQGPWAWGKGRAAPGATRAMARSRGQCRASTSTARACARERERVIARADMSVPRHFYDAAQNEATSEGGGDRASSIALFEHEGHHFAQQHPPDARVATGRPQTQDERAAMDSSRPSPTVVTVTAAHCGSGEPSLASLSQMHAHVPSFASFASSSPPVPREYLASHRGDSSTSLSSSSSSTTPPSPSCYLPPQFSTTSTMCTVFSARAKVSRHRHAVASDAQLPLIGR
jgi:hypothetical protein